MLSTHHLKAHYGDFQALFGIDFLIKENETIAIIGANGAGKSTFLKSICGLLQSPKGQLFFNQKDIGQLPAEARVPLGIALVPEGRKLFKSLSVEENLRIGAYTKRKGPWSLTRVYELFPALLEKRHAPAQSLSGGQQQMVAIGRALLSNPKLLLCDEISLGLSPLIVKDIYNALPKICAEGLAVVLVEQDIDAALKASSRFYCLMHGKVTLEGRSSEAQRKDISAAYFGIARDAS